MANVVIPAAEIYRDFLYGKWYARIDEEVEEYSVRLEDDDGRNPAIYTEVAEVRQYDDVGLGLAQAIACLPALLKAARAVLNDPWDGGAEANRPQLTEAETKLLDIIAYLDMDPPNARSLADDGGAES